MLVRGSGAMETFVKIKTVACMMIAGIALAGCPLNAKYSISGTLVGLHSATGLVLENNGGDSITLLQDGTFEFSEGITNTDAYSVTVTTQPSNPTQTCTVRNGTGTVDKAEVINVIVVCTQPG